MKNICSLEGCGGLVLARGWCRKHYLRWYKHGDPEITMDRGKGIVVAALANTTHGLSGHPLYSTWHSMMARCYSPGSAKYHRYGARGIMVCERWHDVSLFIADVGGRPDGMSLDRIDNDGHYSPGNCRWATALEQARNRPQAKLTDDQRSDAIRLYEKFGSPKLVADMLGIEPHDVKNTVYGDRKRRIMESLVGSQSD